MIQCQNGAPHSAAILTASKRSANHLRGKENFSNSLEDAFISVGYMWVNPFPLQYIECLEVKNYYSSVQDGKKTPKYQ